MDEHQKSHEELLFLYDQSQQDIKFAKLQEWRITYYALILMFGLAFLRISLPSDICSELDPWLKGGFIFITVAVAVISICLLIIIEYDLKQYRLRYKRIAENKHYITDEFRIIFGLKIMYPKLHQLLFKEKSWREKKEFVTVKICTIGLISILMFLLHLSF